MDDVASRTRTKLSSAEIQRRQDALAHASANARLEGQFSSAESEAISDAFTQGEIEFDELLRRLRVRHGMR